MARKVITQLSSTGTKRVYLVASYAPLFPGHGSAGVQGSKRPGAAGHQCHQTGREAAGTASCHPEGGAQEPWGKSLQPQKSNASTFVYYVCIWTQMYICTYKYSGPCLVQEMFDFLLQLFRLA